MKSLSFNFSTLCKLKIFLRNYSKSSSIETIGFTVPNKSEFSNFNPRENYELPTSFDRKEWYPKHMGLQMKIMEANLQSVDLILEVHDARVALTGRNPMFEKRLYLIRPHILVLNKKDLIDMERYKEPVEAYYREKGIRNIVWTDCTQRIHKQWYGLRDKMLELLQNEWHFNRAIKTEYQVMVVGVPNVGKSSLINSIRMNNLGIKNKGTNEGPIPGVTTRVQFRMRIWDRPTIYVLDTPGVLNPWVHDLDSAMKLAACNLILESATKPYFVADYLLYYMNKFGDFSYVDLLEMDAPSNDIKEVLMQLCKLKNLSKKVYTPSGANQVWDMDSAANRFLGMFRNCEFTDNFLDREQLGFFDSSQRSKRKKKKMKN